VKETEDIKVLIVTLIKTIRLIPEKALLSQDIFNLKSFMKKIFKINTSPEVQTSTNTVAESDDQMRGSFAEKNYTRTGTTVRLYECKVNQAHIEGFVTRYDDFNRTCAALSIYDIELERPSFRPAFELQSENEACYITSIEDNIDVEGDMYFEVQFGIKGWSISALSNNCHVLGVMHAKFHQYRFSDFDLKYTITDDDVKYLCQEIYSFFTDTEPDPRYALK